MKTHQSGSVLAISLVLLTAITLIAMMNMQRSGLHTKIVANNQHRATVFTAAECDNEQAFNQIRYANTEELSIAMDSPGQWITMDTVVTCNPLVTTLTQVQNVWNGNALGNPNTSRLRNTNSRGKNGAGVENFITRTIASLPNDMRSGQKVGISIDTPEQ